MAIAATNYWPDTRCAKAFWGQHDLPPYRQLLADTVAWADPGPGERWLDLGCGGGAITRALWERSDGAVAEVVGADCAAANAHAYDRLRENLTPPPGDRVRFICHDFSGGLGAFADRAFDPPYLVDPPAVIPIDVGRQLFVDDFLIQSTSLTRRFHHR